MFKMTLAAVLMCVNFASCSSDDDFGPNESNKPQKPKEYIVSLGYTGELSVSESPLSRAEAEEKNDLYGFSVTYCPNVAGQTTYEPYAYGLFDDITSIKVKLLEGYKYRFATTMIVNGKNVIHYVGNEYKWPFLMILNNEFTYSDKLMNYVEYSTINNPSYNRYPADRYYGNLADFIPSEENDNAQIYMKRVVFGAKFVAENLDEGKLNVIVEKAPSVTLTPEEAATEEIIYTLSGVKSAYETDDYSEEVAINIKWVKANSVTVPLGEHKINFKRNKLTTITIKVADITSDNNVSVELEDEEMGEGDNITIENGEIFDTTIGTETE